MSPNGANTSTPRRTATILDVASLAGVSKSTVSNVIRGFPGVSKATRLRVEAAIEQLSYRPNVLARQLVQQRTTILGVVVGDLANPFFAEMAKLIERYAASRGYTAMFCNTEGDAQSELAGVETLLEYRVAGIVFLAFSGDRRSVDAARAQKVPLAFVGCSGEWGDTFVVDDLRGGRLATQHLLDLGHEHIACLTIPELADESDSTRLEGYRSALQSAGRRPSTVINWSPGAELADVNGREMPLAGVLRGPDRPTAIFATNDLAAVDLLEFADRVGLRVPDDLSIVGFDNVPMAGLARISLTTVAQPREDLAQLGVAGLADRVQGQIAGPPRTILLGVELVVRSSTAPPQSRS